MLALVLFDDPFIVIALPTESINAHAGMAPGPIQDGRPNFFVIAGVFLENSLMIATLKDHPLFICCLKHPRRTYLRSKINIIEAHAFEPGNPFVPVFFIGRWRASEREVIMAETAAQIDRLIMKNYLPPIQPKSPKTKAFLNSTPGLPSR